MNDRTEPTDDDVDRVGRIMDKAATADRRALFAALQAAVGEIVDAHYRPTGMPRYAPLSRVEEAIDLGAEVGSPEHLAHVRQKWAALEDGHE